MFDIPRCQDYKGSNGVDVSNRRDAHLKTSTGSTDDLRELVDRLTRQNEALTARVHELEAERRTIKQSGFVLVCCTLRFAETFSLPCF